MNGIGVIWYFGRGVESAFVQASPNAIYWFLSLSTDDMRSGPVDVHSVMRRWTPRFDTQFHDLTSATAPSDLRLDELFSREPLAQWGAGPVTLLGDAAHPMLPHTGQGAAQALEDAVALGRVLRPGGDHRAALRRYERVRARLTSRVIRMGPRIARITTTKNRVVGYLRNGVIRVVPEFALAIAFMQAGADPHRDLT